MIKLGRVSVETKGLPIAENENGIEQLFQV